MQTMIRIRTALQVGSSHSFGQFLKKLVRTTAQQDSSKPSKKLNSSAKSKLPSFSFLTKRETIQYFC